MRLENEGLKRFQELAIPGETRIAGWAALAQALGVKGPVRKPVMFIRQNKGTLSKTRRTGEFKRLTDAEVTSLETIVNEAFEGFNAQGTSASEIHTGDEPEAVRELTFPDPQEAYVFDRGVVTFWGQDGERRVQCAVSREALDDHFKGDKKDELEVFRANRRAIEEEARKKYLAGAIEPDGSVLIRTLDLAR